MQSAHGRLSGGWISFCFSLMVGWSTCTRAQVPNEQPITGTRSTPASLIGTRVTPSPGLSRESMLEQRVAQLEAVVKQLQSQIRVPAEVSIGGSTEGGSGLADSEPGVTPSPGASPGGPNAGQTQSASSGIGVPSQSFPVIPAPQNRFNSPATLEDKAGRFRFGPGFELATDDNEFILQFHNLTQFDYRGYLPGGQDPTHASFVIPRQWFMWNGHITKEVGFFVSLSNGIDAVSMLDDFIDFNYDRRLQFRAGRFKTPFTYEFFVEPIQGLITPERSLFFNNFGQNRDLGIMAYGQLLNGPNFDQPSKVQYATGIFNGSRNGYAARQDGKHFSGYLNFHPFGEQTDTLLENLNVGGSFVAGSNSQPNQPGTFRTQQAMTGNASFGIPFLILNDQFREQGNMVFWDLHVAWFYKQLAVISEWQSGFQNYARFATQAEATKQIRVPVQSFYVELGYLLTGETRSSVGIVKPNNPFSLRSGHLGWGAWEAFGRYDFMDIGSSIYSYGLASTTGNANRLWMTDAGLGWYMSQYVKMIFDWNHVEFNNPVTYAPGKYTPTSNTFWWRLQLYF